MLVATVEIGPLVELPVLADVGFVATKTALFASKTASASAEQQNLGA